MALSAGLALHAGPLTIAIEPEMTWSSNRAFSTVPVQEEDLSPDAYPWVPGTIDWPQRMGGASIFALGVGQSFVGVRTGAGEIGLSNEAIHWGPLLRYPLLMGTTAGGFPHLYVAPPTLSTPLGDFAAAVLWGRLLESDFFDQDPANDENLLSAVRVEWRAPDDGDLQIAGSIVYREPTGGSISAADLLGLLGLPLLSGDQSEELFEEDGFAAVSACLGCLRSDLQAFASWGRGDFFGSLEDLITEPDHSQFWGVGFERSWSVGPRLWKLRGEYATTAASDTHQGPRGGFGETVYRHTRSRQGHTHRGQLLGASLGPGSVGVFVALARHSEARVTQAHVERIAWDVDTAKRLSLTRPVEGDIEWSLGLRRTAYGLLGTTLVADGTLGVSFRTNRFFLSTVDGSPRRETNVWGNLALVWTP